MSIEPSPESAFSIPPDGSGRIVDKVATRMTEREIALALDLGHVAAFGVAPSQKRMSVAWAMICHETGRGQAIWNRNFGNVDATDEWHGDIMSLTADEGSGATVHKQTKWLRAYPDAYSGAVGWWQFMAEHYAKALTVFDTGDGDAGALALKGYFSGDMDAYRRELRLLAAEYVRRTEKGGL